MIFIDQYFLLDDFNFVYNILEVFLYFQLKFYNTLDFFSGSVQERGRDVLAEARDTLRVLVGKVEDRLDGIQVVVLRLVFLHRVFLHLDREIENLYE